MYPNTDLSGGAETVIDILYSYAHKYLQSSSHLLVATYKASNPKNRLDYNILSYLCSSELLSLFYLFSKLTFKSSQRPTRIIITSHSHANLISAFFSIFSTNTIVVCRESTVIFTRADKPWFFGFIFKFLYSLLYRFVDLVICQTEFQSQYFKSHLNFLPTEKVVHFSNPLENLSFQENTREVLRYDTSQVYLLDFIEITFIGSLNNNKDPFLFVDTIKSLVDLKFARKYIVNIIGDGPLYSQLLCHINSFPISSVQWFMHGHLEKDLVASYLLQSHIFLSLSYQEGFPNVLLEAMQANVPFIGSTNSFQDTSLPINYFTDRSPSTIAKLITKTFSCSSFFTNNYSNYLLANHNPSVFFEKLLKAICK